MDTRIIQNIINIMRKATIKGDEALAYAEAMQALELIHEENKAHQENIEQAGS